MSDGALAEREGREHHEGAGHEEVPGEEVQPGEGHVPAADEDGQEEVAEYRGDPGDDDEEDHDDAVDGEHRVVGLPRQERAVGIEHLDAHEDAQDDGDGEEAQHRDHVEHPDALVVGGREKAPQAGALAVILVPGTFVVSGPVGVSLQCRISH